MKFYIAKGLNIIFEGNLSTVKRDVSAKYKKEGSSWTCLKSDKNIEWEAENLYKRGLLTPYPTLAAAKAALEK